MTTASQKRAALARRIAGPGLVSAPGIFDMISARIADEQGFDALYMTGYGVSASQFGLPDAGLVTLTEMASSVARMADLCSTPLIADADTGYGGLLNVRHTVRTYERAGAAALQLEDQVFPKKCGHTPGRQVIPLEDMVDKIRVAVDSRHDANLLVIARTDARTTHGLAVALERADAFARAGADLIFVESPESEAEMAEITRQIGKPTVANIVDGGRTPVLGKDRLEALGFKLAIFPATGFLAAGEALKRAYGELRARGSSKDIATPLASFTEFNRLVGFPDVWAFDARYAAAIEDAAE